MSSPIKRILVTDAIQKEFSQILKQSGVEIVEKKLSKSELLEEVKHYDALVVRSATKVTKEVLDAGSNLKLVGRAGVGVDNIDVKYASEKNILVMNAPAGSTISVAEHTVALILSMARKIPQATASVKNGDWKPKEFMGNEIYSKTIAIIGLGRIGREVAVRLQAFGMNTIGYDPIVPAEVAAQAGIEFVQLDEIWSRADYITLHTPLVDSTYHLVNLKSLEKCREGVKIVNVARGGIIDEDALLDALESGKVGAVALDVYESEPPSNKKLLQHKNLISTVHNGASTTEGQQRIAETLAQQIVKFNTSDYQSLAHLSVLNPPK